MFFFKIVGQSTSALVITLEMEGQVKCIVGYVIVLHF